MSTDSDTEKQATEEAVMVTPPPVELPPLPKQVMYYVTENGVQQGPISEAELRASVDSGARTQDVLVWAEGMEGWKPYREVFGAKRPSLDVKTVTSSALKAKDSVLSAVGKMDSVVGTTAGLGKLEGFSWSMFFSAVFKKHSDDEMYEIFNCGTPTSTPSLSEVSASWPTPWLFTRFLFWGVALTLLFFWGFYEFSNLNMLPGFIFFASCAIPFSVFIMFYELNVRRDVSMYNAIRCFLGGGTVSLLYALLIFSHLSFLEGAWWAGPIEETAKLLAVLFIASFFKLRNGRILTGVLLGCAVGAGFAIFETAGYVFRSFLREFLQYRFDISNVVDVAVMRGILSPLCHVVWTAVTAGAFYIVSNLREKENAAGNASSGGSRGIDWHTLADVRFLRIALIPMVLHMIWNAGSIWGKVVTGNAAYLVYALLGFVAWAVALRLVQAGIHQVRQEKEDAAAAEALAAEQGGEAIPAENSPAV